MPWRHIGYGFAVFVLAVVIFGGGFIFGFQAGEQYPQQIIVQGVSNVTPDGGAAGVDFGTFWQAWDMIDEVYLNAVDVSPDQKVYGAIRGLVQSLGDPYTEYFDPADSQKFEEDVQGNFGGIGAEIGMRREQIVVVAPLAGTPAERAGLKPGDAILLVDASPTDGLTVEQAVQMIRGPRGSEVTLTIMREGWKRPEEVKIVRETIVIPTLDFAMKEGNIAHIRLHSFNANVNRLFYQSVLQALARGAQGMVLDVRNNPGGYLEVAVDLAGWFVPRGEKVVSEEGREGVLEEFRAEGNAALQEFPVVALINGGSASASEILAGALRDLRGVKLIGEKTFGKGTVQQIVELRDGSAMKLTIAHWVLPSGTALTDEGLAPDIEVVPTDADFESGNDVQLTKALEVVRELVQTSETSSG